MKKIIGVFLLSMASGSSIAGTAINCHEVNEMSNKMVEVCLDQTNRHLNENYKELVKQYGKKSADDKKLLKNMQLGWIKMRDA